MSSNAEFLKSVGKVPLLTCLINSCTYFLTLLNVDLSQYLGHILVETAKTFSLFLNLQTPVELSNESNYGFDYDYKILQCS